MTAWLLLLSLVAGAAEPAELHPRVQELVDAGRLDQAHTLLEEAAPGLEDGGLQELELWWSRLEISRAEGELDQALSQARRSLELSREVLGPEHPSTGQALLREGAVLLALGRLDEAESTYRSAQTLLEAGLPADDAERAQGLVGLALVAQQREELDQAWEHATRARAVLDTSHSPSHRIQGDVSLLLGQLAVRRGQYTEGMAAYQQALEHHRHALGPTHPLCSMAQEGLGDALLGLGRYEEAQSAYLIALEGFRQRPGPDSLEAAHCGLSLSRVAELLGDYELALERADQARLALEPRVGPEHAMVADLLSQAGVCLYYLGRYQEAAELLERRHQVEEGQESPPTAAQAASTAMLASVLEELGQYDRALTLHAEALEALQAVYGPDHPQVAAALNNQGALLYNLGRYHEAGQAWSRSLQIAEEVYGPDHPEVATYLNNVAVAWETEGRAEEAEALYQRAHALLVRSVGEDHPEVADSYLNLGHLALDRGDTPQGRALIEQGVRSLERSLGPDHVRVGVALHLLAEAELVSGDLLEARRHAERSQQIFAEQLAPDHPYQALALDTLALVHRSQGDSLRARRLYLRALTLYEAAKGPEHLDVGRMRLGLALVELQLGRYEEARANAERSLAIVQASLGEAHPEVGPKLLTLAHVELAEGHPSEAEALATLALQIFDESLEPDTLGHANALDLRAWARRETADLHGAREDLIASLAMREAGYARAHPSIANNLSGLARVEGLLGMDRAPDLARRGLREQLAFTEEHAPWLSERELLSVLAKGRLCLDVLLTLVDRPGDEREAWQATLRWKGLVGRLLQERQVEAEGELARTARELAALTLAEVPPGEEQARLERMDVLVERRERLERERTGTHTPDRPVAITPEAVCRALPRRAALVDYLRYDTPTGPRYLAFVVRSGRCGQVHRVDLGEAASLEEAVREWREHLDAAAPTPRIDELGLRARARVWDPIAPLLGSSRQVLLVPDGAVAGVSFAALPTGGGAYLVEERPILSTLDSAAQLLEPPSRIQGRGALLVGDVDYGAPSEAQSRTCLDITWQALPATRQEIDHIGEILRAHGEYVRPLTGAAASVDGLEDWAPGHRIIHLATHGFFATDRCRIGASGDSLDEVVGFSPMALSGVVLAGANEPARDHEDGLLTAEEVAHLDLRGTELVVLSACETGLGEVVSGEGVLGLRRAFAGAGVRSLVTSLWHVPDTETAQIMEHLYQGMARGHSAPEALRDAQRAVLEASREQGEAMPSDWGAFVVSGGQ